MALSSGWSNAAHFMMARKQRDKKGMGTSYFLKVIPQ
jgi:hypothetical protein